MNNLPVLDSLMEQAFLAEFSDRWDRLIKPDETTPENRDSNFDLIMSLINDLAPKGPSVVNSFCVPTVSEQPLMYWWVKKLLLEQVLMSLDTILVSKRSNRDISEEDFLEEANWILIKSRKLALELEEAQHTINIHQIVQPDVEEL